MMRPPRGVWSFMIRNACCVHKNGAVRLVDTTACHCARLKSSNGTGGAPMPALLKRRSSRPWASITWANSAAIEPGSAMSAETARLLPTFSPSLLVSCSISMRRPASTTGKPAALRRRHAPHRSQSLLCFLPRSLAPALLCFWFYFCLVGWPWNVLMRRAQRRRPARAQIVKIRLAGLDAVIEIGLADIGAHHQHVDRQADADIGPHRRIHRDQAGLQRFVQ